MGIEIQARSPLKGLSFASSSSAEKKGFTHRRCHVQAHEWRLKQPGPNHPSLPSAQGAPPAPGHPPGVSLPFHSQTVAPGWDGEAAMSSASPPWAWPHPPGPGATADAGALPLQDQDQAHAGEGPLFEHAQKPHFTPQITPPHPKTSCAPDGSSLC